MSSNVIKARELLTMDGPAVVKRKVQLACRDANEIVAQAQTEARRIVEEGRRKAQEISDASREEGYRIGAAEWNDALVQAWRSRDQYVDQNEAALLKLAVRIAEKLIGEELRLAPQTIVSIVKEATHSARRAKHLTIQVHPVNANLVGERLSVLRNPTGLSREIEIVTNSALAVGDCVIESEIGIIDAKLETQLKNMERLLTLEVPT